VCAAVRATLLYCVSVRVRVWAHACASCVVHGCDAGCDRAHLCGRAHRGSPRVNAYSVFRRVLGTGRFPGVARGCPPQHPPSHTRVVACVRVAATPFSFPQRVISSVTGLKPDVVRGGVSWINGKTLFVDMPSAATAEQVVLASQGVSPGIAVLCCFRAHVGVHYGERCIVCTCVCPHTVHAFVVWSAMKCGRERAAAWRTWLGAAFVCELGFQRIATARWVSFTSLCSRRGRCRRCCGRRGGFGHHGPQDPSVRVALPHLPLLPLPHTHTPHPPPAGRRLCSCFYQGTLVRHRSVPSSMCMCGVVWCGVVCCGVLRCGVVWYVVGC
jgi:hypothetical protein